MRCARPVPVSSPAQIPDLAVVGEAPGGTEDRRGEPFVGKSGMVLRKKLASVGFIPENVAFLNAVSCRPSVSKEKRTKHGIITYDKDRTPTHEEMDACRGNLFAQLQAIRPRFILLCGATALRAYRPDLRLNAHHGRLYVWEGEWLVMATYHPASVFHDKRTGPIMDSDIELMRLLVKGEVDPSDAVSGWCTMCGEVAEFYDPNLVGYCDEHWHDKELKTKPANRKKVQSAWWASTRYGQRGGKVKAKGSAMPVELFPDVE